MNSSSSVSTLFVALAMGCSCLVASADSPADKVAASMPQRWVYNEYFSAQSPDTDSWWRVFDDSLLDSLISRGIENNYNLAIASRRIEIARQQLRQTRSAFYPTVGVDGSWTKARTSGLMGQVATPASTSSYFSAGVSASWEIDVFGKIASQAKSGKALVEVSRADRAGALLSLSSEIATAYFQLRVWQAELAVASWHSERQEKIVKITEARMEAGIGNMLEVAQAREVYYSTQASVPMLENSIETAINSIAVLLGDYPENVRQLLEPRRPLPEYRTVVPAGVPAELLRRRPDVVAAEQTIASQAALLGVAKKDFLPTLSIDGSIGTAAHRADDLMKKQSFTYSIAPRLSWTVFSGFARSASVAVARENLRNSYDTYEQTLLTAVEEVNNAMASYSNSLRHIEAINQVLEQSDKAYTLSVDLYKKGLTPFNNVVSAQLSILENRNSLVVAQGEALTYLVDVYKALGGGWNGL